MNFFFLFFLSLQLNISWKMNHRCLKKAFWMEYCVSNEITLKSKREYGRQVMQQMSKDWKCTESALTSWATKWTAWSLLHLSLSKEAHMCFLKNHNIHFTEYSPLVSTVGFVWPETLPEANHVTSVKTFFFFFCIFSSVNKVYFFFFFPKQWGCHRIV